METSSICRFLPGMKNGTVGRAPATKKNEGRALDLYAKVF